MKWRRLAAIATAIAIAVGCAKTSNEYSQANCEKKAGIGKCTELNGVWVKAAPPVTLPPAPTVEATPTPFTYISAEGTRPPPTLAATPTPIPTPARPSDTPGTLVIEDRDNKSGRTREFAVEGNWDVQYGFGNGDLQGQSSCSINVRVKNPDGSNADFDDISDTGAGKGTQHYTGSGSFYLDVALNCSQSSSSGEPRYFVQVFD